MDAVIEVNNFFAAWGGIGIQCHLFVFIVFHILIQNAHETGGWKHCLCPFPVILCRGCQQENLSLCNTLLIQQHSIMCACSCTYKRCVCVFTTGSACSCPLSDIIETCVFVYARAADGCVSSA